MEIKIPYLSPGDFGGKYEIKYRTLEAKIIAVSDLRAPKRGELARAQYRDITININAYRWTVMPTEEIPTNAVKGISDFAYTESAFDEEVLPAFNVASAEKLIEKEVLVLYEDGSPIGLIHLDEEVILKK